MAENQHLNGYHVAELATDADFDQFVSLPPNKKTAILTEDELISYLREYTKQRGFIADVAADMGVSAQHLGMILNGKRKLTRRMLDKWGVEIVYRLEIK